MVKYCYEGTAIVVVSCRVFWGSGSWFKMFYMYPGITEYVSHWMILICLHTTFLTTATQQTFVQIRGTVYVGLRWLLLGFIRDVEV